MLKWVPPKSGKAGGIDSLKPKKAAGIRVKNYIPQDNAEKNKSSHGQQTNSDVATHAARSDTGPQTISRRGNRDDSPRP